MSKSGFASERLKYTGTGAYLNRVLLHASDQVTGPNLNAVKMQEVERDYPGTQQVCQRKSRDLRVIFMGG